MPCRSTQDRQVMVESSDKTWSTGEGNGKPLQYSCLANPMNSMKRQKDMTLKDELPSILYIVVCICQSQISQFVSPPQEIFENIQKHEILMFQSFKNLL